MNTARRFAAGSNEWCDAQVPFQREANAAKNNVRVADPVPALTIVVMPKAAK